MAITDWGPATWRLFHSLAVRLTDDNFAAIGSSMTALIVYICSNLPCPDCTRHATAFWKRQLQIHPVRTANDLRQILFVFHNSVNARKRKPQFPIDGIDRYKEVNLAFAFKTFATHYYARGDLSRLNDTFRRKECLDRVREWIVRHAPQLCLPAPGP